MTSLPKTPHPLAARPSDPADRAARHREHMLRALCLADAAVLALVQTECTFAEGDGGVRWYDTRPLLDVREYAAASCDLHAQALAYGLERRVLIAHPQGYTDLHHTYLVRVQARPMPPLPPLSPDGARRTAIAPR